MLIIGFEFLAAAYGGEGSQMPPPFHPFCRASGGPPTRSTLADTGQREAVVEARMVHTHKADSRSEKGYAARQLLEYDRAVAKPSVPSWTAIGQAGATSERSGHAPMAVSPWHLVRHGIHTFHAQLVASHSHQQARAKRSQQPTPYKWQGAAERRRARRTSPRPCIGAAPAGRESE